MKSGIPISDFREVVATQVEKFKIAGDKNIFLIKGAEISSKESLRDAVHFSVDGAAGFAEKLTKEIETILTHTSNY